MSMKKGSKILLIVILLIILFSGVYEGLMSSGFSAILPIYIVLACIFASAYIIIMRGVLSSPSSTHFSDELPEEERKELQSKHEKNFEKAKPFLVLFIAVVAALFIDSILIFLVELFPDLSEKILSAISK